MSPTARTAQTHFGALLALTLGCARGPDQTVADAPFPGVRSGSRLRANFMGAAPRDSTVAQFLSFHDLATGQDCDPTQLYDGGFACIPRTGFTPPLFRDAACTLPAARIDSNLCAGCNPTLVRTYHLGDSWNAGTVDVLKLTTPGALVYETYAPSPDGKCVSGGIVGSPAERVPLDTFAKFAPHIERRDGLGLVWVSSEDGAIALVGPVLGPAATPAAPSDCQGISWWLPTPTASSKGLFADALCTIPQFGLDGIPPRTEGTFVRNVDDCSVFQLGPPNKAGFAMTDGRCVSGPAGNPATPVAGPFPEVIRATRGNGPLQLTFDSDLARRQLTPLVQFHDGTRGVDCGPRTIESSTVCTPTGYSGPALFWLDSQCTIPALLSRQAIPANVTVVEIPVGPSRSRLFAPIAEVHTTLFQLGGAANGLCFELPPDPDPQDVRYSARELHAADFAAIETWTE